MSVTDQERDIIRTILEFEQGTTTHMLPEVMENPVSNYTDPDQLKQETSILFRHFPIIVAHTSEMPNAGDFITHDETGTPLLITRTDDGEVKAFLNVCRHRGARVESEPCGNTRRFSCPYHSWTYDIRGRLRGVPQPQGFADIDLEEHGLVELPSHERFGLIWVVPSPQGQPVDFDSWLAPMEEQFELLGLESHVIFKKWALHKNMSWRLALEGFQESYHFCSAHRDTACSNYLDNQSLFSNFKPHVRHSVPLPHITRLREQPEEQWEYRPYFMDQNYLFPANFVQVMTDHVYVHTIVPTGPGTCAFYCMMLVAEEPTDEKAERYWQKNYDVVRVVFDEDFSIGEGIQKGFETGANDHFTFGTFECGLHFGQKAIDAALDGTLTVNYSSS